MTICGKTYAELIMPHRQSSYQSSDACMLNSGNQVLKSHERQPVFTCFRESKCIYRFGQKSTSQKYLLDPDVDKLLLELESKGRRLEYDGVTLANLKSNGDRKPKESVSDRSRATRIIMVIEKIEKKTLPESDDTAKRALKPITGNAGRFVVIAISDTTQTTSVLISRNLTQVSYRVTHQNGETQLSQRVLVRRQKIYTGTGSMRCLSQQRTVP
jgi:hypothetical protein